MTHWGRRYVWYVRYASTNTGAERQRKEGTWRAADWGRQGVQCCTGPRKNTRKEKRKRKDHWKLLQREHLKLFFRPTRPKLGTDKNTRASYSIVTSHLLDCQRYWQVKRNKEAVGEARQIELVALIYLFLIENKKQHYFVWGIWFLFQWWCYEGKTQWDKKKRYVGVYNLLKRPKRACEHRYPSPGDCKLSWALEWPKEQEAELLPACVLNLGWFGKQMLCLSRVPRASHTSGHISLQVLPDSMRQNQLYAWVEFLKMEVSCIPSQTHSASEADLKISVWERAAPACTIEGAGWPF